MAAPSPMPVFSPSSRVRDFFQGFLLPFSALGLIFRSGRLFGLTALSTVVTAGSLVGLTVLLWQVTPRLTAWIWARPEGWLLTLWYVLLAITFLLLFVIGASTVPLLVLAPLQDPISEATEALCEDERPPSSSLGTLIRQTLAALGHTLLRIFWLLLGHAALLVLHFIPVLGQLTWTIAAPLWTMGWLAAEYLDGPMTRHDYPFSAVRRAVWGRLPLCLGFGAAVHIILWVPVLNFFFVPMAIVGGTLLFLGLRACGTLPGRAAGP